MRNLSFKTSVCSMLFLFILASQTSTAFAARVGRNIMRGRDALLDGNPQAALPNFESIAQSNPNYNNCIHIFCVGIWTYLGRTQHELGKNEQALQSLMQGKGRHRTDRFNQIYLGLVKARTGQTKEGTTELDAGLTTLHSWLANLTPAQDGDLWDPTGRLKQGILNTRELLRADTIDWDRVDRDIRKLAVNFEQEGRDVLDERRDMQRRRGRR